MKNKLKIGLALGSGGPRGYTIIGVLKILEKYNIEIDYIAGSSIGAIIGGAYAIEKNLEKIKDVTFSLGERKEVFDTLSDLGRSRQGLVQGKKFLEKIKSYVGERKIEDLVIPFTAVATDNETGEAVLLNSGSLAEAMRASSSIPIFFAPYVTSKGVLLDGGVSEQVPVDIVKGMGADFVIAVNLSENIQTAEKKGRFSEAQHYLALLYKNLARENCRLADVVISPKFDTANWPENFKNREALILEGERAAEEKIAEILEKTRDEKRGD